MDKEKKKAEVLPEHGFCFVCGSENPKGIGLRWYADETGEIFSEYTLGLEQQGPPGHAHGGASAAILDEAMGMAAWYRGFKIVSVNLNISFLKPVPLGVKLKVRGRIKEKKGKRIFAEGEIVLPNGNVAVKGASILVEPEGFFDAYEEEYNRLMKKRGEGDS
jgi:acyl-coenzyme A thioesterase PaaI-like protein